MITMLNKAVQISLLSVVFLYINTTDNFELSVPLYLMLQSL